MDQSSGYESIAFDFIKWRSSIGSSSVKRWSKSLQNSSMVLDLGCGFGFPVSKILTEQKHIVYGIDGSPTLVQAYQNNFPKNEVCCENVQESNFYNLNFDAIIAWGLFFLLPATYQEVLIKKISNHLKPGGLFLFTSPKQKVRWTDALTGLPSESLGKEIYRSLQINNGLQVIEEFTDEGGNYYFSSKKL